MSAGIDLAIRSAYIASGRPRSGFPRVPEEIAKISRKAVRYINVMLLSPLTPVFQARRVSEDGFDRLPRFASYASRSGLIAARRAVSAPVGDSVHRPRLRIDPNCVRIPLLSALSIDRMPHPLKSLDGPGMLPGQSVFDLYTIGKPGVMQPWSVHGVRW